MKHLTSVKNFVPDVAFDDQNNFTYSYVGENISEGFLSGRNFDESTYKYMYDDKINPFFGLLDPNITDISRFSRNNLLSGVRSTPTPYTFAYKYEYNEQGLPTKRTQTAGGSNDVITFTYEGY